MHSKNNNKTHTFIQGLRPFSSSIPKTLKKHLKRGGYNYSNIVDNWTKMMNKKISDACYPITVKMGKEMREGTDGFTYSYNEGPMVFPDPLDGPSRTIITGEGGTSPSRFKHVVKFRPPKSAYDALELGNEEHQAVRKSLGLKKNEWIRRLIPIELERLNMFPDNHTIGQTDAKRAFFMGNALVVGIVEKIGYELANSMKN